MTESIVDRICKKFGGQTALGKAIAVDQSTISHWKRRGGIPSRQIQRILSIARDRGIDLAPADFFEAPPGRSNAA